MVNETSFNQALEGVPQSERHSTEAEIAHLEYASALANDPWTPGVIAQMTYPEDIGGTHWVVAQNPGVDQSGEYMIATQFKLAVINLNIPKQHWFGAYARVARRPAPGFGTGRCCGGLSACEGVGGGGLGPCGNSMCGDTNYYDSSVMGPYKNALPHAAHPGLAFVNGIELSPTFCMPKLLPGCSNTTYACGSGLIIDPNYAWQASVPQSTCTGTNLAEC
jgi:hypothetical protein